MTSQKYRSRRAFRRIHKKVTGGKTIVQYKRRKTARPKCASCGKSLSGMSRLFAVQARTIAKTKKRPERPYGGKLCSPCARIKIIEAAELRMRN